MKPLPSVLPVMLLAAACGGTDDPAARGGSDGGIPGADAAGAPEIFRLGGTYDLAPGEETNLCARVNLEEDRWVTGLAPTRGEGTHHVIAALDSSPGEPGISPCEAFEFDWTSLFAASAGSPALTFPEGVALHLPAGSQLILQMHVVNASGEPMVGAESAVDLTLAREADVVHTADVALVGPLDIAISSEGDRAKAVCTMRGPTNYFAVFPHMHGLGRHAKVWVEQGGVEKVVHDADFNPDNQRFVTFDPIPLAQGDGIGIECTYGAPPPGSAPVAFGPFTKDEMCFAISYRYPSAGLSVGSLCFD
jgi:hypothetical protein